MILLFISRLTIYKCIDKTLAAGIAVGLSDRYHRPKAPEIGDDAKSWVVGLACYKAQRSWVGGGIVDLITAGEVYW